MFRWSEFLFFGDTFDAQEIHLFNSLNTVPLEPVFLRNVQGIVLFLFLWRPCDFAKPQNRNPSKAKDDCSCWHITVFRSHFPEFLKAWLVRKYRLSVTIFYTSFNCLKDFVL
jgi:hypothetical protein